MEPETLSQIRYELVTEDVFGGAQYVIRRVEEIGRFYSREQAVQFMRDTTKERQARDA